MTSDLSARLQEMTEAIQTTIERLCENGFQSCTHKLVKVRDELAALSALPAASGPVEWPSVAKPAADGDGYRAVSHHIEHRMSEQQAALWNSCRASCISAYERAAPTPAPVAASGEVVRFFASGPEGSFFTETAYDANRIIRRAGFDRDEWTVTELTTPPPAAVSFDPASIGPFAAAAAMMEPPK